VRLCESGEWDRRCNAMSPGRGEGAKARAKIPSAIQALGADRHSEPWPPKARPGLRSGGPSGPRNKAVAEIVGGGPVRSGVLTYGEWLPVGAGTLERDTERRFCPDGFLG
jgi:hypothetical protein